ncbi:polysaccharide deacetylase family protein [Chryseosolibacter indicus]|uniref:Polysaccharide deacetylase family protein n=1 Tax=Chryseosolibacter indicus TaxID=2782351 RepID=A0ABS5VQP4_9BACT|nr:polysaccharide deacetylase family protein [Chryseosolibacter indicus]MBT1703757.1 polysaccharide deacetylase family protein [Chryseosolibacter indicus]
MRCNLSAIIIGITLLSFSASAQKNWNNKKCAVVLTYDDALNVHLDNVIPVLDSLGLKGTFYLSAYFPGSKNRLSDWKKAAANGHELGNHTLFHPCIGKSKGRSWVRKERDLDNYSMERLVEEIRMTNVFLQALDGKTKRTFAYPCGDMTVNDSSYVNNISNDFVSARGVEGRMSSINDANLFAIGSYMINGQSGEEMIKLVKEAIKNNSLLVFLFHGVGGEHDLNVSLPAHRQLLQFLKKHEHEIWITPFIEATEYMKKNQTINK